MKAVREFINDFLGGAYDGLLADGKAMVKRNGEMMWDNGKCFGYDMMKILIVQRLNV